MQMSFSVDAEVEINVEHKDSDEDERDGKPVANDDDDTGSRTVADSVNRHVSLYTTQFYLFFFC